MAKVIIHLVISLDGFIAKEDESDYEWMFKYGGDEPDPLAEDVINNLGAVILGNKDFRLNLVTEDALPYGGKDVPQFVVTHNQRDPLKIGNLTFQFITGGVEETIRRAKEAAGDKKVAILGASISQQALNLGLVDEILLHQVPLILGKGLRLFENIDREIELNPEKIITPGKGISALYSVKQ